MQTSRRAEAVETAGIIRPLGIAEIRRASGEAVCSDRNPDGSGQIRGSFHDNGHAAGPIDVESELICPDPEAGIARLHLWEPEHGWRSAQSWTPSSRARQVIHGCIDVTFEHARR